MSSLSVKNTFYFRGILDWVRSGNNVTGYTTKTFTFYYIPYTNLTGVATSNNQSSFSASNSISQKISVSDIYYHGVDKNGLLIPSIIGYYPYNNEVSSTHDHDYLVPINSRTYEKEWGIYYLSNTISGEYVEPTPTPTPSDVDAIIGAIDNQNENYWGSSGDVSGEIQKDEISGEILGFISDSSGELAQNEIFDALSDFEQGFFNLFVERNPLSLDLKIYWPNIYTLADGNEEFLISSGEINFSQMCRDNETLGNIQAVVRVIFNFYFGVSLLVYLYNLVLSTLGIDNPFLYENPENGYEDMVYDVNTGTETYYNHRYNPYSHLRHTTYIWRRK